VAPDRVSEVEDDPLFRVGETMVLFLREYAPGPFYVIGGPTGRFEVIHGTVVSCQPESVRLPANQTLDQFASEVGRL